MAVIDQSKIRNFCIVAHIDHGKSTLADRIIEKTGLLTSREMQAQVLDNMDLERERGITIKAQAVRTVYKAQDGEEYIFNLIDTPGHVDFNYEVSRSLAACDGAILVVDAAQGIEAQTLANVYLALDHDLDVFPVINKIDLPSADPQRVIEEIEDVIGIEAQDAPLISAKNGIGIEEVLEQIVKKIPSPKGNPDNPLQALIFDSVYDSYKGVIIFCRVMEGTVKKGTMIRMMATGAKEEVVEVGYFGAGQFIPCDELSAGMVGYITASIKNVKDTAVGDTVTDDNNPCAEPLPGYKKVQSMVYCGLYPVDGSEYENLKVALEKLQLNDAALEYEPETSAALGFGFRCGFLGLLHLEIIEERLDREFDLGLITTAPSVIYKVHKTTGEVEEIYNQQQEKGWGKSIVEVLSKEIQKEFPEVKGFSASNLWRMRNFYLTYKDIENLAPLVREISWTKNIVITEKCKDNLEREFYIKMTKKYGWSKDVLINHIENKSYEKYLINQTNFDETLPEKYVNQAKLAVKDEYIFDIMELSEQHSERELERALVDNIKDFLGEMGGNFAFMGNQYHLNVDGNDFYIDLLLYHRSLKSLVAIELKIGEFKPEYVGQLQFYLTVLDKQVKMESENPSIGIIICKEKNRTVVEYALSNSDKPIGVATYKIHDSLPEQMKDLLPSPEEIKKRLEGLDNEN